MSGYANYERCGRAAMVLLLVCGSWSDTPTRAESAGLDPFAGEPVPASAPSGPAESAATRGGAIGPSGSVAGQGPTIGQVQFHDDELSLVFQVVSDATGWSIFPAAKVAGKVTLYARDITAGDLLDTAIMMAGFVYVRQGEIISVMTYEDYMLYYGVIKRTFQLKYRDAAQVSAVLTPFVTVRGKLIPDPSSRALVVYEVPTNLPMLEDIVQKLDVPADSRIVKVVKLEYAEAEALGRYLSQVFANEQKSAATNNTGASRPIAPAAVSGSQPAGPAADVLVSAEETVQIHPVARTNHLILRGYSADLARLEELIDQLDVPEDLQTRHYPVVHLSAPDVLSSLETTLGVYGSSGQRRSGSDRRSSGSSKTPAGDGLGESERIRLSYLEETNAIVVTAPIVVHHQVAEFLQLCDTPPLQMAGGIRHYRLHNASANDVAGILLELINQGEQRLENGAFKLGSASKTPSVTGPSSPGPDTSGASPGSPAAASGSPSPAALASSLGAGSDGLIGVAGERRTEKPRITFSETTNTVIIQATVQEHVQFAQIIAELDRQLPQILLEAILVEIRGTDEIDVGVELENFGRPNDSVGRLLFTAFGFSTVNPATGQRTLNVGPGGTAAITREEDVPAIIHALQASGKSRIRSAPRLLVNDNSPGIIQSIAEEPYSQVNASTTVATTSFGGFVQAGTQLRITPHISNDDYLRLEYEITLNSFRGASSSPNLPPARDTSTINSQATVPDGGTLIVAGLSHRIARELGTSLPLIGDVPVLDLVFGRKTTNEENIRLYVFLRPTILRDSHFRQLKVISVQELEEAGEPAAYPSNDLVDLEEG